MFEILDLFQLELVVWKMLQHSAIVRTLGLKAGRDQVAMPTVS